MGLGTWGDVDLRFKGASTSQVTGARNEMMMVDNDGQMIFGDLVALKPPDIRLTGRKNPEKTSPRKLVPIGNRTRVRWVANAHGTACPAAVNSVRACVYMCVCVCICVKFLSPPNNFQTSYPIEMKFWQHIVSYRNSRTSLIPFLNFQNWAREKFLKSFFLHLINMGKFSNSYSIQFNSIQFNSQTHITPLIYDLDDWNLVYR